MRRCKFERFATNEKGKIIKNENGSSELETVEGNFLEFGSSFDFELKCPFTIAIIELDNGKIEMAFPKHVTFIDKIDRGLPGRLCWHTDSKLKCLFDTSTSNLDRKSPNKIEDRSDKISFEDGLGD